MNPRRLIVTVLALVLVAAASPFAQSADDDFKPLFNGKDLSGFKFIVKGEPVEPGATVRVEKETIIVSGKPNGYFVTDKSFKNYVLRFDWRYKRPDALADDAKFGGNSGLLVHIASTGHKGQDWPRSIEVQGMNREHGKIFAIAGAKGKFETFVDAQKKAIKPVGEWNTTEVTSENGKLTAKVNGELVSEGTSELMEGPIGWQSEGAEIHFRKIEIKEMK